ncbi:Aldehyde/histidinol dehydrogenase [Blyttiomyces helicus]|uniref:Aldehyde/histidinol dehydrogenase n=1 Tax=Blyttiomyces helicus TaxID=388810 RepID=A0A4P9WLS0_9FUNG|nr:Aldehyde/histidinol dehydrogenase [Blyttiomyces helicus]|eukprot:RKO93033.1 Aldehyde/histidinol dehydrogenase [Blyttiomyces helicus]
MSVPFPAESSPTWSGTPHASFPSIKDAQDPTSILCHDPATGWSLGRARAATREEVRDAVQRARDAQVTFAESGFEVRRAVLRTLLEWIVENQMEISRVAARDSGKTLIDASFGEILTTCEKLRWTIAEGETVLAPEYRTPGGLITLHKSARVEYHPIGVCGTIVSWNYPFHNTIGPIISALMAGNGCVVKCSEHAAWSTPFWNSVVKAALRVNGVEEDLVTLINGWADAGEALIEYADKITFIGSPTVGKLVMRAASATLTPVVLELGGKDAALVFNDADYGQITQVAMRAAFQNSGQNCAGLERLIVQEGIHDRLIGDLERMICALRVGPPLGEEKVDVGAMTMDAQIPIIQRLIDDAVAKGARVLVGGKKFLHPKYPKGQFYTPTLIVDVTTDMLISQEEVFGPVLMVMKFETESEAIALANSSAFGLGSGVFTLDYARGERIARRIKAGMCNINDFGVNYLCQCLPFGGVGKSGFDRFAGVEGLRGNTNLRSATTDRFAALGVRTQLPAPVRYPLTQASEDFQRNLVGMAYSDGWRKRVESLVGLDERRRMLAFPQDDSLKTSEITSEVTLTVANRPSHIHLIPFYYPSLRSSSSSSKKSPICSRMRRRRASTPSPASAATNSGKTSPASFRRAAYSRASRAMFWHE